ncbi:MAG TPA: ribosome-associated translation inhibitor RaiA [Candidatus Binataceae bacterium]|jgi:putative sigma-54 modulation protein|nr:ribosome-associated translation inhibitor RaiA [Candidatus Binataceae bacterium]
MPAKSKVRQAGANKRSKTAVRARRKPRVEAKVTVTFRHVAPTPALAQYAERKLGRVAKFLKREAEAHVILSVDKYRQCGEVTVKSGRFLVSAQEEDKDLYSVIDLLAAKVQRQVKKHLEKIEARKVRSPSAVEILSEPLEEAGEGEDLESASGARQQ